MYTKKIVRQTLLALAGSSLVGLAQAQDELVEFGLEHTALDLAELSLEGGKIKVSNLGSSGCDGVRIATPPVDGYDGIYAPAGLSDPDDQVTYDFYGAVPGGVPVKVGGFQVQNVGAEMLELTLETTSGAPIGIRALHNGAVVYEESNVASSGDWKITISIEIEPIDAHVSFGDSWDDWGAGASWNGATDGGGTTGLINGQAVFFDHLYFYPEAPGQPDMQLAYVDIMAAGVPELLLERAALQMFGASVSALGGAVFSSGGDDLTVTGAAGDPAGAQLDLGPTAGATVDLSGLPSPAAPGDRLTMLAEGVLDGVAGQALATASFTSGADGVVVQPDFTAVGAQVSTVEVYDGGQLVASVPGLSGDVAELPSLAFDITLCFTYGSFKLEIKLEDFAAPITVGGTTYVGDELRIVGESGFDHTGWVELLSLSLEGSSGSLTIDGVDVKRPDFYSEIVAMEAATGGPQEFVINSGSDHAGQLYVALGSLSGTAPGTPFAGVILPVNFDAYTNVLLNGAPFFTGTIGVLDGNGYATCSLNLPPTPGYAGLELDHAVISLGPSLLPDFVSEPVHLSLQ